MELSSVDKKWDGCRITCSLLTHPRALRLFIYRLLRCDAAHTLLVEPCILKKPPKSQYTLLFSKTLIEVPITSVREIFVATLPSASPSFLSKRVV